jgi:hypothetical protein
LLFRRTRRPIGFPKDRVKLFHVGVREFFPQALVIGALFGAWNVIFPFSCAGLSATSLCGRHRDILALPRLQG